MSLVNSAIAFVAEDRNLAYAKANMESLTEGWGVSAFGARAMRANPRWLGFRTSLSRGIRRRGNRDRKARLSAGIGEHRRSG